MTLMKALIVTAALAAAASASAAEPQNNDHYFDGWRLGVGAGDVFTHLDHGLSGAALAGSHGSESANLALTSGFDYQLGDRVVVGAEYALLAGQRPIHKATASGTFDVKPGLAEQLTARAGVLLTPQYLLFARAGYAEQRFSRADRDASGFVTASSHKSRFAPLFGVGLEHAFTTRLSARSEIQTARFASGIHETTGMFSLHYKF
jgi:opacity protein-like surface antigen